MRRPLTDQRVDLRDAVDPHDLRAQELRPEAEDRERQRPGRDDGVQRSASRSARKITAIACGGLPIALTDDVHGPPGTA